MYFLQIFDLRKAIDMSKKLHLHFCFVRDFIFNCFYLQAFVFIPTRFQMSCYMYWIDTVSSLLLNFKEKKPICLHATIFRRSYPPASVSFYEYARNDLYQRKTHKSFTHLHRIQKTTLSTRNSCGGMTHLKTDMHKNKTNIGQLVADTTHV